jgi:hypothetical protein
MMSRLQSLEALRERTRAGRPIDEAAVNEARRAVYGDDAAMSAAELDALLAIDAAADERPDAWIGLVSEAVCDHYVHQLAPAGHIDEALADTLIRRIDHDGRIATPSELEALVRCLEVAESAPARLGLYALRQVARAVIEGDAPLLRGARLEPGRIGADEVELLRRILFAAGGHGALGVSREEAAILFELNDACAGLDNHPAWADLFVKAIANCMVAASGHRPPTRAEALRRADFLDTENPGVTGFFARMLAGGLGGLFAGLPSVEGGFRDANARKAAESEAAAAIDDAEARWLADRIGRDGGLTANERALVALLEREAPDLHPAIRAAIAQAA